MNKKSVFTFLFLLNIFFTLSLRGQQTSNIRVGNFVIDSIVIKLDSLSILPESFILQGIEKSDFTVDFITSTLYIQNPSMIGKPVSYSYRVFSMDLSKKHANKKSDIIVPKRSGYFPQLHTIVPARELENDDLSILSSGTISRGFSLGNNQDLVLSSTLNLQLSGMLAEGLEVSANITDRNIPIQPEGNTLTIQDFDRIFIRLNYLNKYSLNAGDIDIISPPASYFMVVNKRILGMDFSSSQTLKENMTLNNKIGGGVNKGTFVRQTLSVSNGVQGPYRLTGKNNESNIIILSGTERVYLDGKLLLRGQENDYVIDYNLGEITFTSKNLITTEKRIIIEFEYKSDYYTHFTLYSYNEFSHEKNDKLKLNINFVHDQDAKNRSIQPELNNAQKLFLSELGDNIENAYFPKVDSTQYNPNEILYIKKDTTVNGILYNSIYVHSNNSQEELYRLGFSLMGDNKGNYVLERSTSNGRVFKWVAPIDSIPQGNYEPVMLLSTPKLTQLGTISASYEIKKHTLIETELAFSNHDLNTFSKIGNNDNVGFAVKTLVKNNFKLKKNKKETDWYYKNAIRYEFIHKNFYTTESYRDIEFERDYNLSKDFSNDKGEQMISWRSGFSHQAYGEFFYNFNLYSRFKEVNVLRNAITGFLQKDGFKFNTNTAYLTSSDLYHKTNFLKSEQFLSKSFKKIEIGIVDLLEYNIFNNKNTNSVSGNSYAFNEAKIFIKNNDSLPYLYNISFLNRVDHKTINEQLGLSSIHNEAKISFELAKLKNNKIRGNITYRNSQIKDSTARFNSENFFVGSIEYSGRFFKNAIIVTTYYEAGSGLEQKKTFSYLKVADGQGTHTWNDYNGNGIEELDEFEVTNFQDKGNYIKIWINTPEYVMTHNNMITQTLLLRPYNVWSKKNGFLKFLSRFANSTTFQSSLKNTIKNSVAAFNPFFFNINDSLLVRSTLNFSNTLSFNQLSPYWGIDFIARINQNKHLLYYGFEHNTFNAQEVIIRGNPHKNVTLRCEYTHSEKKLFSEYMDTRNYRILSHNIKGTFRHTFRNMLFTSLMYTAKQKENREGIEKSLQHHFELNINFRVPKKGNLVAGLEFVHIQYQGNSNSSIHYEMLDGLSNGNNALWNIGYQSNITDYLQLELSYNGRATAGNKAIHTGNIQIRAYF